jgi:hypothetical protein
MVRYMLLMTPLSNSAIADVDCPGVDAREEEPGTVIDLAELGFAGVDERPQIGDGTSGLRNVGCSSLPPFVSYCSARKCSGKQTVDLFGARVVCSKLVERGWVDAFFLSGGGSN